MVFPIVLARAGGLRVPYLLTLQDGDPFTHIFRRWFIFPFIPLLYAGFRHATAISALSTYLASWARQMGYTGAVAIVPNGADLTRFISRPSQSISAGSIVTLVTSSRLVHKNALDDVIRALVLLPLNVRFVIYGSGPEEAMLRQLARDLGVTGRVDFKGYVSHTELAAAYADAHIFIRPSRTEGFGASFPEAMAAGLPVIATQEGGIADFLFDEKRNPDMPATGWAVDVHSPEQIARAVKDIMTNPEKVERIRRNALALVREKYDWDLIARAMNVLFDRVAQTR
jgi:glycosyltransferase involved in cell wall biosynthesis